jgi:FkbM family methyltransferase
MGELVGPGNLCVDIGSNVGQTIEAFDACGARTVALEPNPDCIPALEWQFGRNPRVTIVKKAVGSVPGSATLNFSGTNTTSSLRDDWGESNKERLTVEVTTLDALISEFGPPKLCKVDVEGFETEVFKGLSRPIPNIDFEGHLKELDRAREVLSTLSRLGNIEQANLTDSEHTGWLLDRWVSADELRDGLASRLTQFGNVVVRLAT